MNIKVIIISYGLLAIAIFLAREAFSEVKRKQYVEVRPRQARHSFSFNSGETINHLQYNTCARHYQIHGSGKKISFSYDPMALERDFCPLELALLSIKGKQIYGYYDFENPNYKAEAVIWCNGIPVRSKGVGLCQLKRGLVFRVLFNYQVKITSKCLDKVLVGMQFDLKVDKDRCYYFAEEVKSKRRFRLSSLAYDTW